jgi:drug/metabolite transporter (DMT)-like permease
VRGILWMLLSMVAFPAMDTLAKSLTQTLPVIEVVWARFFFTLVLLAAIYRHRLPRTLVSSRPGLQVVRGLIILTGAALFFAGIRFIPLSDATAVVAISPALVTALAIPLLRERVGIRQWLGVAMGFAGVLIIIRPGAGIVHWAVVFPLGTAVLFALHQIAARVLGHTDSALTTLVYSTGVGAIVASAAVPFFWVAPSLREWLFMAVMGILNAIGQFAMNRAFQVAPAVVVTPFTYSNLIWATLFGFMIFGDVPDSWTVTGAAVIVTSGLFILFRRRTRVRSR